jgi:hypothetical protein
VSAVAADEVERLTPDEVRTLFLFETLNDEQLRWLADQGHVERCAAGSYIFREAVLRRARRHGRAVAPRTGR